MAFEIRNEIFTVKWNEIHFISFTVADQDAPRQLSRIHDVDGTYYCHGLGTSAVLDCHLVATSRTASWFHRCPVFQQGGLVWTWDGGTYCGILNTQQQQMTNVVHQLVAMSPTAMWHLDAMWERSVVGAGELACLPQLLAICFHSWCMLAIICQPSCLSSEEMRGGVGLLLTWNDEDSDDNRNHHCLDDMPCCHRELSSCISWAGDVALPHHRCCGHAVVVWGIEQWSRRWWLLVGVVTQWRWMMVVVDRKKVCLLMSFMCCSQQMPLMQLSIKTQQLLTWSIM